MFGLGVPELVVIFVIALLIFGPKRLPDIGKSLGKALAELKKSTQEFKDTVETEMRDVKDATDEVKKMGSMQIESPYPEEQVKVDATTPNTEKASEEKSPEDEQRTDEHR